MRHFPLDDRTADRLLSGQLSPDDAPPGLGGLAAFARAAADPANHSQLPGQSSVVAAMAAAVMEVEQSTIPHSTPSRRRSMIGKLLTAKVAAGLAVGALSVGTAAAAVTGALPGQGSGHHTSVSMDTSTSSSSTSSTTQDTQDTQVTSGVTTKSPTNGALPQTGIANSHAEYGLCTAFLATNPVPPSDSPSTTPHNDSSKAFSTLIKDLGGGDVNTTRAECQNYVKTKPTDSTDTGSSTDTGKPAGTPSSHESSDSHAGTPSVSTPSSGGTGTADTASTGASSAGAGNSARH